MKKGIKEIIALSALLTPFAAFAQLNTAQGTFGYIITQIQGIVSTVIPLLMGVAMVVFIWGIIKFITAAGDEEKRKSAVHLITYGIIGLFVLVAIWGIISVIKTSFGVPAEVTPMPIGIPTRIP